MRPRLFITLVGFGAALVVANARAQTPDDPYERINRRFYASAIHVNEKYFGPLVRFYHALTPGLIGVAIHNMITNLREPVVIVNDVLQVRLRAAGRDTVRLATNTSLGIGGIIDLAGKEGMPHHDNDFGITLGVWGAKPGPYLFIPFLGPSTVRDALGSGVDVLLNPFTYVRFPGRLTLQYSSLAVGTVDSRLRSQGQFEALTADAADPYATVRSVYLQSREAEVRGEDAAPELPPIDEPAPSGAAAPAPSADRSDRPPPEPNIRPLREADADVDAPIATAFPRDTDQTASRRFAAAN